MRSHYMSRYHKKIKLYARIQSIIQVLFLASTNRTRVVNLNLRCNTTFLLVHIQMQQIVHELAPLFVCSSFNLNFQKLSLPLYDFIFVSPLWLYLCFSPPLSSMTTNVQIFMRIKSINVRVKLWFNLDYLPRICNLVWSKDKLFHPSWIIMVILTMLNYTS